MRRRPAVTVRCVADRYADKARERIVEFSFPNGKGGLMAFRQSDGGVCTINLYRLDDGVEVYAGKARVSEREPTGKYRVSQFEDPRDRPWRCLYCMAALSEGETCKDPDCIRQLRAAQIRMGKQVSENARQAFYCAHGCRRADECPHWDYEGEDGSGYMLDPTRLGVVRQEEWHAFTVTFRVNDDKPRVWLRFAPDTDHARDAAVEAIEAEWPAARFIEIVSVIPERPRRTVSEVFHATL